MAEKNNNVFLNCPYDAAYKDLFFATVFAVLCCGKTPRCALERIDSGENRLDKIFGLIRQSRYSIHDLCRIELASNGYPRFNMPFELGLWIGFSELNSRAKDRNTRSCLVVDEEAHRYRDFLSDLSGRDITIHEASPEKLIVAIRDFLQSLDPVPLPGPKQVLEMYVLLLQDWPDLCSSAGMIPDSSSFADMAHLIHKWLLARVEEDPARKTV